MKKSKILKIALVLLISFLIITPTYASNFDFSGFEGGSAPGTVKKLTENTLGTAISVVRIVGTGIAIIMIMIIGVKYMIAAPGDRADIKKHAVPFVIGAVVLFGTSQILGVILEFSKTISA